MTKQQNYKLFVWIITLVFLVKKAQPDCLPGYSSYEGNCYGSPQDAMYTWDQAEQYCITLGGHLTSVTSQAQHNFLLQLISQYKSINSELWNEVWIGLYHPSPVNFDSDYQTKRQGWQWTDGSLYSYYAWDPLDPSNNERYGRISHGVWLGSLHGNVHNNFICKIVVNSLRIDVPQPYPTAAVRTRSYYPRRTTYPIFLGNPTPRVAAPTTRYAPVYPTIKPKPTIFNILPREASDKATQFIVVTPTTPAKDSNIDSIPGNDDINSIDTKNPRPPDKRLQKEESKGTGLPMKLIPVAAVVPTVAIVMIIILVMVVYRRSSKSNIYQEAETKNYNNKDFHMTPLSTIRDPTRSQYYNETYRSLSSLFRKAAVPPPPPVYGNVESGTNTLKSCYENNYVG